MNKQSINKLRLVSIVLSTLGLVDALYFNLD